MNAMNAMNDAMKVIVTGGSGFTGKRVITMLVARGHEVIALVRRAEAARIVEALGARAVAGDLTDAASLDAALAESGAEALVNVAPLGLGHAPALVAAAEDVGIRRAVFISTTSNFTKGNPGVRATRLAGEDAIMASSLAWTILRPTMVFGGPEDRNFARLMRVLGRVPLLPIPNCGSSLQQPIHVDDLATLIANALERDVAVGRSYEVAGPEPLPLREIVRESARAVGANPWLVPVPAAPAITLLRLYERVVRRPRLRAEQVERLRDDKTYDISPAVVDLTHVPRSFAAGIRQEAALLAKEKR